MKTFWLLGAIVLAASITSNLKAQTRVHGMVVDASFEPPQVLPGAQILQLGTQNGTLADAEGHFSLNLLPAAAQTIIISASGLLPDTLDLQGYKGQMLTIRLQRASLGEVTVTSRRRSSYISSLDPLLTERITSQELTKAACCNLGESFQTNPSVDVNYADAVSGAKTITLLGLSGVYSSLLVEGLPWYNGLGRPYGLNYLAGPWLGAIQVSKGSGPVVLGYESITGQINIELKSPEEEKLLLNVFGNELGRAEANINYHYRLSDRWTGSIFTHASTVPRDIDRNGDGFLDLPGTELYNILTKFSYQGKRGFEGKFGIQALSETRQGGQLTAYSSTDPAIRAASYRINVRTQRYSYFSKTGYVWLAKPYQSVGLQTSGLYHQTDQLFGIRTYDGTQRRWSGNLIFQSALGDTRHSYRLGLTYLLDDYKETYNGQRYRRQESVPGTYLEYTFTPNPKLTVMAGARVDAHNLFGTFFSPRLHLRYAFTEQTTLRLAAGKGYRTANVFAENTPTLSSNRTTVVATDLRAEEAWNIGVSLTQNFEWAFREGSVVLDFYRTEFQNQVVVDYDRNPQAIYIGNLVGRSLANSFQIEVNYELVKLLDVKLAYKYYDVRSTYAGQLQQTMLTPRHRALLNASYNLRHWQLDYTLSYYGPQRLHNFAEHHPGYLLRESSPAYTRSDAQITYKANPRLEFYIGGENLLDFKQPNPIIRADAPFDQYFDTTYVWGPILGRVVYGGVRYTLDKSRFKNKAPSL